MKRLKNKPLIALIGGAVLLFAAIIFSSGNEIGKLLPGAGGLSGGEETLVFVEAIVELPTETPLPPTPEEPIEGPKLVETPTQAPEVYTKEKEKEEEEEEPEDKPTLPPEVPVELQLSIEGLGAGCDSASFAVRVRNLSSNTKANQISLSLQMIAGSQYVAALAPESWSIGALEAGAEISEEFNLSINELWMSAPSGEEITLEVAGTQSHGNQTIAVNSAQGSMVNPGNCLPPTETVVGELVVDLDNQNQSCNVVYFTVSVENTSPNQQAEGVVVSLQVTDGANYVQSMVPYTWNAQDISAGQRIYNAVFLVMNDNWRNAATGTNLSLQARITGESGGFALTDKSASSGTALQPGNCMAPTPTVEAGSGAAETAKTPIPILQYMASPGSNQPAGDNFILFHTYRDDNLEIYRLDGAEGSSNARLYNLSQSPSVDSRPSLSYDKAWVVFQSDRDGNIELYYTDSQGNEQTRLTNTEANNINPMFATDNQTIVFQSDRNGNWDLFSIDLTSGIERQLTASIHDEVNPSWSPDGQMLVFQSNRNGNWDILALNVKNGQETLVTAAPEDEIFPAWSTKGGQIAYLCQTKGIWELFVIEANGKNRLQVTHGDDDTGNHTWSPDGARLAYQAKRDGNLDIYIYDLAAKAEYRLTDFAGPDSAPSWDALGKNIAFTSTRNGSPNIFVVSWQGGPQYNLTVHPGTDKWSEWSPSREMGSRGR